MKSTKPKHEAKPSDARSPSAIAEGDKMDFDKEEDFEDENKKTLTYILVTERRKGLGTSREITMVINALQQAIKNVSQLVRSYGLFKGMQTGKLSIKSFDQKNLLKRCESIFFKTLVTSPTVCLMGSCYSNELIEINNSEHGKFVVTFVPLEGNLSINYKMVSGSVFSIYRKLNREFVSKEDFMQNGSSMLTAAYALYGRNTVLVFAPTPGAGVYEFILDPVTNEFVKTNSKLEIPTHGTLYTMNEGRSRSMEPIILESISRKKSMNIARGKILKCRYTGSIIADTHAVIKEGGLLIAPPYSDFPSGMIKQQFLGNPLAFILIEAGGAASDGKDQLVEVSVDDPHQNMPLYLGSIKEHQEFVRIINGMYKISRMNII